MTSNLKAEAPREKRITTILCLFLVLMMVWSIFVDKADDNRAFLVGQAVAFVLITIVNFRLAYKTFFGPVGERSWLAIAIFCGFGTLGLWLVVTKLETLV